MLPLSEAAFDLVTPSRLDRRTGSPLLGSRVCGPSLRVLIVSDVHFFREGCPKSLSQWTHEAPATRVERSAIHRSLEESLQSRTPSLCVGRLKEHCAVISRHLLIVDQI